MGFTDLDSLDKFLTIFLKILNNEIDTSTEPGIQKILLEQKGLIRTLVSMIRHLDKLSEDQIKESLLEVLEDKDLAEFITIACQPQDIDALLDYKQDLLQ